jgi:hypothetical protein
MTDAMGALAALKDTDGEGHLVGPAAYFKAHRRVLPEVLQDATARREAAARELLDLRTKGYAERAERCARTLMARHGVSAELAHSFVSHLALAWGLERRARREALLRDVREVTALADALLFRAGARHPASVAPDPFAAEAA